MAEMAHKLHHMEIHPAENGGHMVMHHFAHSMSKNGAVMSMPEPERHVFGPEQGHEMLAHLANELKLKESQDKEPTGEEEQET